MNAEDFIDRGDEYFNAKKYNNALNYYTQAINTLPDATDLDELLQTNDSFLRCFKNRSKCSLELKEYLECIDDADTGFLLDNLFLFVILHKACFFWNSSISLC